MSGSNYNLIDMISDEDAMPHGRGIDLRLRSVRESYSGVQLSLRNISNGPINGAQVSLWANYAQNLRGGQVAIVNTSEQARGAQIGGINFLLEDEGPKSTVLQVGLLNFRLGNGTPWYAKCLPGIALRFPKR